MMYSGFQLTEILVSRGSCLFGTKLEEQKKIIYFASLGELINSDCCNHRWSCCSVNIIEAIDLI